MAKILVSDSLAEEGRAILSDNGANEVVYKPEITPEDLVKEIGEYEALVIRSRTQVTAEVLRAAKKCKIVGRAGVGVDNVDIPVATQCGIMVANAPEGNTYSTCEHAISLMMSLIRHIPAGDATMKAGKWEKKKLTGHELYGKTLGIVGLGKIGREVAHRMKSFGMTVWGFDPYVTPEMAERLGVTLKTVAEIVEGADVITVHTPKTKETTNLLDAAAFKKMKKTAYVINCARGGIINEEDLAAALAAGELAGAAIDVFTVEPLPEDHPLRKAPNIVLTPHLGASTTEAQEKVALQVAEQVVNACKGAEVTTALNAPAINPELLKQMKGSLDLAERLGRFIVQMSTQSIKRIKVSVSGTLLDFPTDIITLSVMKGFLEPITDLPVNFVNARTQLQAKGVEVVEARSSQPKDYLSLIEVSALREDGSKISVSGTVFMPNLPRVVAINDLRFEMKPEGNVILMENEDLPGTVGRVGTLLASKNINIAEISWGRDHAGGNAMTAIKVDGEVDQAIINELVALPHVVKAKLIRL